jgi:hypothetical protein
VSALELYRQGARLESKIDRLDEKLDGHAVVLGRHEVEISELKAGVKEIKTALETERAQRANGGWSVRAALIGAAAAGGVSGISLLVQSLTHR